jgi:hypothetical protein
LSWLERRKQIIVPIKYAKKYHGEFNEYYKSHVEEDTNHQYVLMFDEKNKEVKINICKDESRIYPENKVNYIGIIVNKYFMASSLVANSLSSCRSYKPSKI